MIEVEEALARLRTGNSFARLAALSALSVAALSADPQLMVAVAQCLSDPLVQVRELAHRRLQLADDIGDHTLPQLMQFLDTDDAQLQGLAASCIALRKRAWTGPLLLQLRRRTSSLLESPVPAAQLGALRLAEQIGGADRVIAWNVFRLIESPEPRISSAAGRTLSRLKLHPLEALDRLRMMLRAGKRAPLPGIVAAFARFEDAPVDDIGLLPEPLPEESAYELSVLQLASGCGFLPSWGWKGVIAALAHKERSVCDLGCAAWHSLLDTASGRGILISEPPRQLVDALEGLVADLEAERIPAIGLLTAVLKAYHRTVPSFEIPAQPRASADPHGLLFPLGEIARRHNALARCCVTAIDRLLATPDLTRRACGAQLVEHAAMCNKTGFEALLRWVDDRQTGEIFAVRALGALQHPDPRAVVALRNAFGATAQEVHEAAAAALGEHGPTALSALPTLVAYHTFREGRSRAAQDAIAAVIKGSPKRALALLESAREQIYRAPRGGMKALLSLITTVLPEARGEVEVLEIIQSIRNEVGLRLLMEDDAELRTALDSFGQDLV